MSVPPGAAAVFGERLGLAERYAALLAGAGIERGLLGPREADRVWERHVLNCAAIAELVPPGASVADLGSGAGLPGIPLALARPDLTVTLIEPLLRRTSFLDLVVAELDLPVRVMRARAEDVRERFDVVVSRALAPLDRLLRWSAPLLAPGGTILAMKGQSAADEVAAHQDTLRRQHMAPAQVRSITDAVGQTATIVVIQRQEEVAR
jgi:16S rRNA (guanine527-N7)-methyltransferase